jgi:hypothetical protein
MNRRTFLGSTATRLVATATLAHLGLCAPAHAAGTPGTTTAVENFRFDNELNVNGQHLVLNGAGVRYKLVFKLYAMALYLPKKSSSVDEIIAMPGPKRIRMLALREMPVADFGRMTARGIQANATREDFVKILPDIARIGQLYGAYDRTALGDEILMDWTPGAGLTVRFRGALQGDPFVQPELFNTLLKVWLGDKPADAQLKESLLGHAAAPVKDVGDVLN